MGKSRKIMVELYTSCLIQPLAVEVGLVFDYSDNPKAIMEHCGTKSMG